MLLIKKKIPWNAISDARHPLIVNCFGLEMSFDGRQLLKEDMKFDDKNVKSTPDRRGNSLMMKYDFNQNMTRPF